MYYKLNNIFLNEMVEDVCFFPGTGQNCPFPLLPSCPHLKADPSLEGDVADDKADSSMCHQLGQVTVL